MNPTIGVVVGPVLLLVALLLGYPSAQAHVDFAGAPQVQATVLVAAYDHAARGTTARIITLAAPDPVPLDDLRSAPDDLYPGATVTVLIRPGHAVLPSQLRWSLLLPSAGLALAGLLVTAIGISAFRTEPRPSPGDPEAWD